MPRMPSVELSRSVTPDDVMDDIPASMPPKKLKDPEMELREETFELTEEQLEQKIIDAVAQPGKKSKKGKGKQRTPKVEERVKEPANGNAKEEDGDEFEVESIVEHVFRGKRCFYRVRWVGWGEDDDTWEPEENLLPESKSVLAAYHGKIGGVPQPPSKKGQKTPSKTSRKEEAPPTEDDSAPPAAKRAKRTHRRNSNTLDPESKEWKSQTIGSWQPADKNNWEDLVHEVETVERDGDGNLHAFIRFRNGKLSKVAQNLYTQRCPRAMLKFYENHLNFSAMREPEELET